LQFPPQPVPPTFPPDFFDLLSCCKFKMGVIKQLN